MTTTALPLFTAASPAFGFGAYENFKREEFEGYHTTEKVNALIVSALIGTAAAAMIVATTFFPILIWCAPFAFLGLAVAGVKTYLRYCATQCHFPPHLVEELEPQRFHTKKVGEFIQERGAALPLADSTETHRYRLDLIRSAQKSIFLSLYMGEESLDEALDLMKTRMQQNRELKIFLFGSDHFLTPENHARLNALQTAYPDRFFSTLNPEMYHSQHPSFSPQCLSTNHIKLMSIDQGAYTIIGGSALRPFWTQVTGTQHLEKVEDTFDCFKNPIEAKGFRDMDFAFKSAPGGAGTTAFLEGAKLMVRYAHLQDPQGAERLKTQFLDLMRTPAPATTIATFDSRPDKAENIGIKLFSSGPDHIQNSYLHALIERINQARTRIVIGHMYFHPPQIFIDALINAAKRGVKIDIITNSKDKQAPGAHRFFTDLAQVNYRQLFENEGRENVRVFEFYRANTTYHKKAIVIDDLYTGFGSSNLGKKSLEDNPADYEFNAIASSPAFAAATMRVLQTDISLSNQMDPEKARNPSWDTRLLAVFQNLVMSHIL